MSKNNIIYIEYSKYSETIRQQPHNYLLAYKDKAYVQGGRTRWIVDPDNAANAQICIDLFRLITFDYYLKNGSGESVIKAYYDI